MPKKVRKPRLLNLYDGIAQHCTYAQEWNEAECVDISVTMYDLRNMKKLQTWLNNTIKYWESRKS